MTTVSYSTFIWFLDGTYEFGRQTPHQERPENKSIKTFGTTAGSRCLDEFGRHRRNRVGEDANLSKEQLHVNQFSG